MADIPPLAEAIEAADFLSPEDRSTWIAVGMALHEGYGDDAYDAWAAWSGRSTKWNARVGRQQWRSFHRGGGRGLGTLFKLARQAGWRPKARERSETPQERRNRIEARRKAEERARRQREAEERARRQRAARAAEQARQMVQDSIDAPHAYMDAKFPREERVAGQDPWTTGLVAASLVWRGKLLIPMFHPVTDEIRAVQQIEPDGSRKFMPFGVLTRGLVHRLGQRQGPPQTWFVEGYATGIACLLALWARGRREDQVCVCFAASQFRYARRLSASGIVIADHDADGLKYAKESGLRYVVPGAEEEDAWDVWNRDGAAALGWTLLQARRRGR